MIERSRLSNSRDCALARGLQGRRRSLPSSPTDARSSAFVRGSKRARARRTDCQHPKSAPARAGASEPLDVQLNAASLQIFTRADDGQLSKLTVSSRLVIEHQSTRSSLFRRRTDLVSTRHSPQVP